MFRIYGLHTPMFLKTVVAAEELGLNYEVVPVDLMKGEQKSPAHMARHPFGKVPVLEHKGTFIFESNAIVRYLGSQSDSPLYPVDALQRAQVDQWTDYFSHQVGRWCTNIWFQRCIAPKYFEEQPDEKIIADAEEQLLVAMPIINQHLDGKQWLTGNQVTLADTVAYMLVQGYRDAKLNFNDFPAFEQWFDRYAQRPALKKTMQQWG